MLKKFSPLLLSSLLGIGLLALPTVNASAATIPVVPQIASGEMNQGAGLLQQVVTNKDLRKKRVQNKRANKWDRKRHGNRCRTRSGNCRHRHHDGYYYASPWWLLTAPLVLGTTIVVGDDDWGDDHYAWCANRYRSYSRRNNTWVSFGGNVYQCNSPY